MEYQVSAHELADIRDPCKSHKTYYMKQKELNVAFPVDREESSDDIKKGQTSAP